MEEDEIDYGGEGEYESSKSSDAEDVDRALSVLEAGQCLHTLGKCDSGLGYAYLGLTASDRRLTDIRVIPKFRYVLYLDVSGNKLTSENLNVLSTMTYLLMIKADRNRVTYASLEPLPYLQVLTLCKNMLTSTSEISHPLLECLELNHNSIEEVTLNPYDLEKLKTLELRGNILTTTNGIFFPGLIRLYLAENQIEKIEGLEMLVNLEILHLRSNKLANLDGFDHRCAKLDYLNMRNNEITKISELEKLSSLPALSTLVVLENPAIGDQEAEEDPVYRTYILAMLPRLNRIDKDPVNYEEKRVAREFRQQMLRDGTTFADLDTNVN